MAKGIPDNIFNMLAEADKKYNLPAGTMHSIMQQETGGNAKYLDNPTTYHYSLNADGKRIAGHTGKVSTAFGPFGILESTAADPGFGLKPLKDKTSLAEQMDFAAAYASKRGLAAYGEGTKYAQQVSARIGKGNPVPVQVAQAQPSQRVPEGLPVAQLQPTPVERPVQIAEADLVDPRLQVQQPVEDPMQGFQQYAPPPMQVADFNFGNQRPVQTVQPNFKAFNSWIGRA